MKFISYILIIHIMFLTVAPSFGITMASMNHGKHACCEKMSAKKEHCPKSKKSNDCCNDACNPFMSCCNGCALASQTINLSFHLTSEDQKMVLQKQNLSSAYLAAAWHPPKFYLIA
jgi:hypothetical protein